LDLLAGLLRFDVALGRRRFWLSLIAVLVTGDQR
jgi:hypothetical protein